MSLRCDNPSTSKQEKCVTYWKYLDPFIEPDLDLLSEADLDLRRDTDLDLRGDADLDLKIKRSSLSPSLSFLPLLVKS